MKKLIFTIALVVIALSVNAKPKVVHVLSPDMKNSVSISTDVGGFRLQISRNQAVVLNVNDVYMGVNSLKWDGASGLKSVKKKSVDNVLDYVVRRKCASIRENYNEVALVYDDYRFVVRVYSDGVAWRFEGTSQSVGKIEKDNAHFSFAPESMSYTLLTKDLQNWFEENYTYSQVGTLPSDMLSIMPVMVRSGGFNVLIAESDVYNYSGAYLQPSGDGFNSVRAYYPAEEQMFDGTNKRYATKRESYIVEDCLNRTFPWKVVGLFDDDISILSSDLIWLLAEKTEEDWSWIRPGKVLWDWWNHNNIYGVDFKAGINTATYMYLVDYAASNGFEYVLIDEGWSAKDDLLTLNPETDIPAVCRYAEQKGVGVCLWAKWINVDRQLDEAFDLMASWGVKGVKIDFMDRNDAVMVNFYERVAKKAAQCHFLVDFHGSYPPDGMRAKYPNLMTREGVLGMEYNKWSERCTPEHQLIIPYLRQWVGPMDYTPGAMLNAQPESFRINECEPMCQGTRCQNLAMYVVYESPLQMLSDSPTKYEENLGCLEFLRAVPSVWDETVPLKGSIGKDIAIARRSGETWYVGAMNAGDAEEMELSLEFLPEGRYVVDIYTDGVNADLNARDWKRSSMEVTRKSSLRFIMSRNGGMAGIIRKIK